MVDTRKVIATDANIRERVAEIAKRISGDYAGKTLDVVGMLNGASVFCVDLVRQITVPTRLHWLGFTSYPQGNPTGEVRMTLDVTEPLHSRDVLLVEGIVVSGRTPKYLMDLFALRQPASLALCALGKKPHLITVDLPIRYCAFEFADETVVGYGIGGGTDKTRVALIEAER